MNTVPTRWVVLKYGGTSVGSAAHWPTIAGVVRARQEEGLRPVLVHSALAGVSDLLAELGRVAAAQGDHSELLDRIRARHRELVADLGLEIPPGLTELEADLSRVAAGVALTGELSAPLEARLLSAGELMASQVAQAYLRSQGLHVHPEDARSIFRTAGTHPPGDPRHYLAAHFHPDPDPDLATAWEIHRGSVVVTQGFIASDPQGRTVLLGRGGSDTSAAWLAAKLKAERLEIWTDVPGLFSTNPHQNPSARLLKRLSFEEAQEIAATGARVLHPRCLPIAERSGIPVHIHSTTHPEVEGTIITHLPAEGAPRIKAVSARSGLTLISMETVGMWQEPGFLARAFGIFANLGLSIDLVSTSESVVTVTLDDTMGPLDPDTLAYLEARLGELCRVRVIRPCAAVSLVGARMRANLHRLAPVLESFEEHDIYLVSQAASDLNFTVVIEEAQVGPLLRSLHTLAIGSSAEDDVLGPSWEALSRPEPQTGARAPHWWEERREALLELGKERGAVYVYDAATLRRQAAALTGMGSVSRVLYAMKANPNPDVLRCLREAGMGFECVSPGELRRVLELFPDIPRDQVLFTPNFAPRAEYVEAFAAGVRVTLDNLHPLEAWPEVFAGQPIFVRMDVGQGTGHHKHVRTAGVHSKFGVHPSDLDRLEALCREHDVQLVGLHTHSGSGIRDAAHWQGIADELAHIATRFPSVRVLDLGGGLGVPEREGDPALDPAELDRLLARVREAYPHLELWLEPGRYLVSEAGVLLATVTQTKGKRGAYFVGVSTGMNSLIRPALYGAYHRIVNLTRLHEPAQMVATVVGPICETGDRLGRDRPLPHTHEGDVLLVANAGAYGHAMASSYNLREPAGEVLLESG